MANTANKLVRDDTLARVAIANEGIKDVVERFLTQLINTEGEITSLKTRITANETQISQLQTKIAVLENSGIYIDEDNDLAQR